MSFMGVTAHPMTSFVKHLYKALYRLFVMLLIMVIGSKGSFSVFLFLLTRKYIAHIFGYLEFVSFLVIQRLNNFGT